METAHVVSARRIERWHRPGNNQLEAATTTVCGNHNPRTHEAYEGHPLISKVKPTKRKNQPKPASHDLDEPDGLIIKSEHRPCSL